MLFCVLAGFAYAMLLYYKGRTLEISKTLKNLLFFLRFTCVAIIAFLLLEPLVRTEKRTIEKPIIVIAQDNSESLILGEDSLEIKSKFPQELEVLKEKLEENYEVQTYTIGAEIKEGLKLDFKDKSTNLSSLFEEMYTRFYNRNLGAIILASDGIYNKGNSPISYAKRLKGVPVYTVLMGDTSTRKDQLITDLAFNRLAYLGNDFPVEAIVGASKMNGEKMEIVLSHNGKTVYNESYSINSNNFSQGLKYKLTANQTGMQHYRLQIIHKDGELTYVNNTQDFYIEVLNSKQKILLLGDSPHPDMGAIKNALINNMNYDVNAQTAGDFNDDINKYSLLILHQLPSGTNAAKSWIDAAKAKKIPVLYVLGSLSSVTAFNDLNTGITLKRSKSTTTTANAYLNKGFTYFNLDETQLKNITRFPPLQVPFGEWSASPSVSSLFSQKIGSVETGYPLIAFNKERDQKCGVILGEGIWRWRLNNAENSGNTVFFDEIIQKSIQFLASKEDKSYFRVFAKTNYLEDEKLIFDAEVYNESYELINEPDVEMIISNADKKEFRFIFSRNGSSYRLNAGRLPVGEYSYTASVVLNKKTLTASGKFTISPVQLELLNAVANHQVLSNLATETGGKAVFPNQLNSLVDLIKNKEEIVEVSYTSKKLDTILNFKWLFFLILLLFSTEWFIRKWSGAY